MSFGWLCTTTGVYCSSSLNVAAWAIVAPNHTSTFVTTLLGEYFFDLDVLELYPYQVDAVLSESAIRIDIRVDLIDISSAKRGCLYFDETEVVSSKSS